MNLQEFDFPKVSAIDLAFPTIRTNPELLDEAKKRGFYNGYTPYNKLFSTLFYSGGKLNFKKDLSPEFKNKALPYMKAFMGSFEPKHEEKEAICSLLLSELVETESG